MTESTSVKIARLEEQMKTSHGKLDHILQEIEHMRDLQLQLQQHYAELPEVKNTLEGMAKKFSTLEHSMGNMRGYVMGLGTAFGVIGSLIGLVLRKAWGG